MSELHRIVRWLLVLGYIIAVGAPLAAQTPEDSGPAGGLPFTVTLSVGRGMPSGDRTCLVSSYLLPAVEIQSRGRFFVSAAAEGLIPAGSRLLCAPVPTVEPLPSGETLLRSDDRFAFGDRGGHFSVGIGLNIPVAAAAGEARVRLGVARGQDGFADEWLPTVAASIGVVALDDHLVVSLDQRWFRVPSREVMLPEGAWPPSPIGPAPPEGSIEATTLRDWKAFRAVVVGFRF